MLQAIQTKFLGPTSQRGGRIKATCQARTVVVPWDHGMNPEANHKAAAMVCALQCGWSGTWHGGFNAEGEGVFVCEFGSAAFTLASK